MSRLDRTSLAGGIALLVIGLLLLLDSTGELELTAGWATSAFLAGLGVTLLAGGLDSGS